MARSSLNWQRANGQRVPLTVVHSDAPDPHRVIENDMDAGGGNRLDLVAELPKLIVVQCGVD